MSPPANPILFYDGVCGLCNRLVQFTLRHDRRDVFRFLPCRVLAPKKFSSATAPRRLSWTPSTLSQPPGDRTSTSSPARTRSLMFCANWAPAGNSLLYSGSSCHAAFATASTTLSRAIATKSLAGSTPAPFRTRGSGTNSWNRSILRVRNLGFRHNWESLYGIYLKRGVGCGALSGADGYELPQIQLG